jgi:N,N'-diacetyllegionaminate synthase
MMTSGRTFIIAEVGPNHNGSLDLALKYVEALSRLDIDAVKFQLAQPDAVYSKESFKPKYQLENDGCPTAREMSQKYQLTRDEHKQLATACQNSGILYLCTAFDLGSLDFLVSEINVRYVKLASGDLLSLDLLEYIADSNVPVIMSTGMAEYEEIEVAVDLLRSRNNRDIWLLYCVSNYPAPISEVDLRVMANLNEQFHCAVGLSDHTRGNICALAAVAMGATIVEKHVTFDQSMEGPDHKASTSIEEFSGFVETIRTVDSILGNGQRHFSPEEEEIRRSSRKSIVTTRELTVGDKIKRSDVCFKRPGTGISPIKVDDIIGRKTNKTIGRDVVLKSDDLD